MVSYDEAGNAYGNYAERYLNNVISNNSMFTAGVDGMVYSPEEAKKDGGLALRATTSYSDKEKSRYSTQKVIGKILGGLNYMAISTLSGLMEYHRINFPNKWVEKNAENLEKIPELLMNIHNYDGVAMDLGLVGLAGFAFYQGMKSFQKAKAWNWVRRGDTDLL